MCVQILVYRDKRKQAVNQVDDRDNIADIRRAAAGDTGTYKRG